MAKLNEDLNWKSDFVAGCAAVAVRLLEAKIALGLWKLAVTTALPIEPSLVQKTMPYERTEKVVALEQFGNDTPCAARRLKVIEQ